MARNSRVSDVPHHHLARRTNTSTLHVNTCTSHRQLDAPHQHLARRTNTPFVTYNIHHPSTHYPNTTIQHFLRKAS
ncbi:MAG: hypothetical protein KDA92_06265, partial [Planctomycetales bacterium]|nr:hypothetical protein [Planctomycetales bacterium]